MEQLIPPVTRHRCTVDEYLLMEDASETKHEFVRGEIVAMAGGTADHAGAARNVIVQLTNKLSNKPCRVFGSDLKVRVTRANEFRYPDVTVVCGQMIFDPPEKRSTLLNPLILVAVASPSTESVDRREKFDDYMRIESLQEYAIVAHDRHRVDLYYRQPDGIWAIGHAGNGLESSITFRSLDVTLRLADIYAGVELTSPRPVETDD